MSRFVLDCSVTASWCFEDEAEGYGDNVLQSLGDGEAVVPQLWLLELGNVLVTAQRQDRLTEQEGVRFLSLVKSLPIEVARWLDLDLIRSMLPLAREYDLSVYDANYLWIAMEKDLPLATLNEGLKDACRQTGVAVFDP